MNEVLARKVFPKYFENFTIPKTAAEQIIPVYRACPTRRVERESFLNSYEEAGFCVPPDMTADNPQVYCLSLSLTLKGVRRFVAVDSRFQPPYLLAKGHTTKEDGLSCPSNTWKTYQPPAKAKNDPHVDWWLYDGAEPWLAFEEADYEKEREKESVLSG